MSRYEPLETVGSGQWGLRLDTEFDCTGASRVNIVIRRPDGSILTREATTTTTLADGEFQYEFSSADGDLNVPGRYQAFVEVLFGSVPRTSKPVSFNIAPRLDADEA